MSVLLHLLDQVFAQGREFPLLGGKFDGLVFALIGIVGSDRLLGSQVARLLENVLLKAAEQLEFSGGGNQRLPAAAAPPRPHRHRCWLAGWRRAPGGAPRPKRRPWCEAWEAMRS